MDLLSASAVNWSRAQFALTASYHWLFVPLTIGLALIMAIMESIYVKTGDEKWKHTSKFWQKIFGNGRYQPWCGGYLVCNWSFGKTFFRHRF